MAPGDYLGMGGLSSLSAVRRGAAAAVVISLKLAPDSRGGSGVIRSGDTVATQMSKEGGSG